MSERIRTADVLDNYLFLTISRKLFILNYEIINTKPSTK